MDYYHILGVDIAATQKEIVAAYRKKCKLLHPDLNLEVDTTVQMQELNEAYHVLSDSTLRRNYDEQCGYNGIVGEDYGADEDYSDGYPWWYGTYSSHRESYSRSSWKNSTDSYEYGGNSEPVPWWMISLFYGIIMALIKSCQ